MINPLAQYFQHPSDGSATFGVTGPMSKDCGYFQFGHGLVCYGQTSAGYRSETTDNALYEASNDVMFEGCRVKLPFDFCEVITNLTHERYAEVAPGYMSKMIRQLYYSLRPLLPLSLRSPLQRLYLEHREKPRFPAWPIDTTVDELMNRLLLLSLKSAGLDTFPFIWFWPEGATACSIMTHDVETQAGKQFCSNLMGINEEFGIPASFQIVPEERYDASIEFINSIKERGFEVNIQDLNHDGRLFWDYEEFKRRVARINGYGRDFDAAGFRSAVLYRRAEWFELLDFEYDMSVPNVGHYDAQQGGCCTVMPYFIGRVLELPVTTSQDHTVFHYFKTYSLDLWRSQIDSILARHGLVSFIVHPDYVIERRALDAYKQLLLELLKLRSMKDLWITSPGEVNRWWRNRAAMRLFSRNGEWVIEGRDSHRACVAFASLVDDEIVYTISKRNAWPAACAD